MTPISCSWVFATLPEPTASRTSLNRRASIGRAFTRHFQKAGTHGSGPSWKSCPPWDVESGWSRPSERGAKRVGGPPQFAHDFPSAGALCTQFLLHSKRGFLLLPNPLPELRNWANVTSVPRGDDRRGAFRPADGARRFAGRKPLQVAAVQSLIARLSSNPKLKINRKSQIRNPWGSI